MNPTQPRVYIVLLNWNGWRDTVECLESLLRQDYPDYRVIVCDNASADHSVDQISGWAEGSIPAPAPAEDHPLRPLSKPPVTKPVTYQHLQRTEAEQGDIGSAAEPPPLTLISTGGNLGFAGGNNVGIRYALQQSRCDYIWLLNNDTVVEADALKQMVAHSQRLLADGTPNTCGSLVCFYDDPTVVQALGGNGFNAWTGIATQTLGRFLKRDQPIDHCRFQQQLDYITGCSWLLPRPFLDAIGLMEESYFLYYEEIDWVLRSRDEFSLTYAPDAVIYHKEGSSIGSKSMNRSASLLSEFYLARNKFRVAAKFKPMALPVVFLSTLLQALNRLRQGYPAKAWMLLRVMFGKQDYP